MNKALDAALKKAAKQPKPSESLWKGPEVDGVTQGLLAKFLVCRERFRIYAIEGLRPADAFRHRLEYGQMWHTCEESLAGMTMPPGKGLPLQTEVPLKRYAQELCRRYPLQQEQIQHWYQVCRTQFPIYVDYWSKHPDVQNRQPLLQEQVFDVPYRLPSGRTVRLRGKWDSVDLIGKGKSAGIYLNENKTKGDIVEQEIQAQLASGFDLQTMLYLVAYQEWHRQYGIKKTGKGWECSRLAGVRYNVVRRPLSGGLHSIVRGKGTQGSKCPKCKAEGRLKDGEECPKCEGVGRIGAKPEESTEAYYGRLGEIIEADPGYFFMRWRVEITPADIKRFQRECLDPILEQLWDWWECISATPKDPFQGCCQGYTAHYRFPYGVYNVLTEGGTGELDEYLNTGSTLGLYRAETLFQELEDA